MPVHLGPNGNEYAHDRRAPLGADKPHEGSTQTAHTSGVRNTYYTIDTPRGCTIRAIFCPRRAQELALLAVGPRVGRSNRSGARLLRLLLLCRGNDGRRAANTCDSNFRESA